ncbi:MAG: hypothetical protein AB7Q37_17050 [Pyrinomonadaceae bacterium]
MATDRNAENNTERGSALVIALFVLALISVFVAYTLTRTAAEAAAVGNETAEARTLYAAQGSLETMTRNFNKVFELKLNPSINDLNSVRNGAVPALQPQFTFLQELDQTSDSVPAVLTGGPFSGLYAIRDNWRLRTTATDVGGTQIRLTRNVLNNRIPIFQFGIFYEDDLELYRPPRFSFGGRVHSNRHFFVSPGSEGVYFDSRVTAAGHIVTQSWRNWYTGDSGNDDTYIKNASGTFRQLLPSRGSVLNGTPNVFGSGQWADPDLPSSRINPNWASQSAIFDGNLQSQTKPLKLPLKVGNANADLIEMVKRGREVPGTNGGDLYGDGSGTVVPVDNAIADDPITRSERFANKHGIRISLADSKAKLPGCASGTGVTPVSTVCGVRLDGSKDGQTGTILSVSAATAVGDIGLASRGYQPKPMRTSSGGAFNLFPTRVNGERLNAGSGSAREVWIKVEIVNTDDVTGAVVTKDITEDFLSLGVTEVPPSSVNVNSYTGTIISNGSFSSPSSNLTATTPQGASTYPDSRSVIKLQQFAMAGPAIPQGSSNLIYSFGSGSSALNVVRRYRNVGTNDNNVNAGCTSGCTTANSDVNAADLERYGHLKRATVNGTSNVAVVPFPIKMFDMREGYHYDERSTSYFSNLSNLTRNGIMSMVDIDIANLRRFFRGDFNGLFPVDTQFAASNGGVGLSNSDVPQRGGWVLYVSDRRGDADFDGEFDMEDVYGSGLGNDGSMQNGEDVNRNGILDRRYGTESERYRDQMISPVFAAVNDHKYYRRGVRLVNGTVIPGIYDATTPGNTRGFTVSSENGVYVWGNYNATHVNTVPSTGNTPYDQYRPFDTPTHIPASIVADSVTILSNNWNDAQSFETPVTSPYDQSERLATTTQMRFAMIAGDTISSREQTPHQGGITPRMNGGVHNFKRFLERWSGSGASNVRLDYAGSLINLYNSRNNMGSFKCCNTVYNPPIRNWVFDSTFLDPTRIPPGTPFFQYVQTTGFERSTD